MEMPNPYRPPDASLDSAGDASDARLFRISAIGIATLVGSMFAGGIVMARNYRATGRPDLARKAMWWSGIATVAVMVVAMLLPDSVPGLVFVIPQLIAMLQVARQQQGAAIAARQASGAAMYSNWVALGIALLAMAGVLATLVAIAFALQALGISTFDDAG